MGGAEACVLLWAITPVDEERVKLALGSSEERLRFLGGVGIAWRDPVVCGCLSVVVVYVGERKPYDLRIAESTHIRIENQRAYALLCRSLARTSLAQTQPGSRRAVGGKPAAVPSNGASLRAPRVARTLASRPHESYPDATNRGSNERRGRMYGKGCGDQ